MDQARAMQLINEWLGREAANEWAVVVELDELMQEVLAPLPRVGLVAVAAALGVRLRPPKPTCDPTISWLLLIRKELRRRKRVAGD